MKVLHVISDRNIGGAGILLCNLLRHFDREKVESIVALPKGSALTERIAALDIPVYPVTAEISRMHPAGIGEMIRILKHTQPDILHSNAAIASRIAAKRLKIPSIYTRHCCYPPSGIYRLSPIRSVAGACNRHWSDLAIATADAAARNLMQYGIPASRIRTVINGSDPVREVTKEELNALRAAYRLAANDTVIGICARLEPCKGHTTFLEAAKLLIARHPARSLRFLIVGEGSLDQELRQYTKTFGIENSVRFTGFVRDMAPIYRLLSIHVNCSVGTETSCLAISEGMSAGVITVATDYGGNPAMLKDSSAGFLVPVRDPVALADAITRILCDPDLEARMRASAIQTYQARFTAHRMAEEVTEIYRSICR